MGKRKWSGQKKQPPQGPENSKKVKAESWVQDAPGGKAATWKDPSYTNALLEKFYQANEAVVPPEEFPAFLAACRRPLPAAFRISEQRPDVAEYLVHQLTTVWTARLSELAAQQDVSEGSPDGACAADPENEGADQLVSEAPATAASSPVAEEHIVPPRPVNWYPGQGLAWTVTMPRHVLRKSAALKDFNKMLVAEHALGGLARQEEVSMIPPALLDIRQDSTVLDMCAAPGSKTIQLLEMLVTAGRRAGASVSGCVVANDVSFKRAEVLVTQTQKLTELLAHLIIVNHDARNFPRLEYEDGQHWGFDRILCDVMCSGDGTLRKSPDKWDTWSPRESVALHRMQIQVLQRAMYLCNVGGRIVYSTCSMNPVEDEAVLIECLRKGGGCFELVDVSGSLPGLHRRPGVSEWSVMTKGGQLYRTWEDLPDTERPIVLRNCFPPVTEEAKAYVQTLHIDRALRVLPHLQDTGGFFVAVLKKTAHWNPEAKAAAAGAGERAPKGFTHAPPPDTDPDQGVTAAAAVVPGEPECPGDPLPGVSLGTIPVTALQPVGQRSTTPAASDNCALGAHYNNKKLTDYFIPINEDMIAQLRLQIQLPAEFPMQFVHRRERNTAAYKKKLFWCGPTGTRVLRCMHHRGRFETVSAGVRLFEELTIKGKPDHWRFAHEGLSVLLPYLPAYRIIPLSRPDALALIRSKESKLLVTDFEELTRIAIRELLSQGGGPCILHCANASPALRDGLPLSAYCSGSTLLLYLNKLDAASVLYRMGAVGICGEPGSSLAGPTEADADIEDHS